MPTRKGKTADGALIIHGMIIGRVFAIPDLISRPHLGWGRPELILFRQAPGAKK
jgi:hypothetical protein